MPFHPASESLLLGGPMISFECFLVCVSLGIIEFPLVLCFIKNSIMNRNDYYQIIFFIEFFQVDHLYLRWTLQIIQINVLFMLKIYMILGFLQMMIKKDLLSQLSKHIKSTLVGPSQQSLSRFACHDMIPLATMLCESVEDIQIAIKFCNQNDIPFVIKAGGCNQSCSSVMQNALILDFSPLKKISHVRENGKLILTFQGGVNFNDLVEYMTKYNATTGEGFAAPYCWLRRMSGIGAHTIMGNGLLQRMCGFGVDWIKSAKVVLANGDLCFADKENNPDLLWAVKGSGPNIGAVIEITEQLPQQIFNIMDPQAGKEIRTYATSIPINEKTTKMGKDYTNFLESLSENVFPYTIFKMNKTSSDILLLNYQMTYDKELKKINHEPNVSLEKQLSHLITNYGGKHYYEGGHIYETNANTQIRESTKKYYYKIWGAFTNTSQVPQIIEEIVNFYQANPLAAFDDEDINVSSNIIYLDSPIFRARDPTSASWPCTKEENIILYGALAYTNKQLHSQCGQYLARLESTMKKYMHFGSACDCNYPVTDPSLAEWVYAHNYGKLLQIKKTNDPLNKFGNGLFFY